MYIYIYIALSLGYMTHDGNIMVTWWLYGVYMAVCCLHGLCYMA